MHRPSVRRPPFRSQRGSVLIVAMLLSVIIAVALTTYLNLSITTLRISNRTFHNATAMNLAETGLEQALWSFNQAATLGTATAWYGWTQNGSNMSRPFTFGANTVTVLVQGYDGSVPNPKIVSKAVVNAGDSGNAVTKYLEVTLTRRGLFTNGLVAKDSISWVGHPEADSWDSDPDSNSATAAVPYSVLVRSAECTVGCVYGSIALGSGGDVYGYARTGSSGTVSGGSVHSLLSLINDATRISNDFSATFPAVTVPSPSASTTVVSGSVPTSFGSSGPVATDGRRYYVFGSGAAINNDDTTITGDTTFIMINHSGVNAINFTGTKTLTINASASLVIYTNGDIRAFGNAIVNNNQAAQLVIYGTNTSVAGQEFDIGGNGQLCTAIYAPNADVEMKGGGSSGQVSGSVVARTISMNGGTDFHYDIALGRLTGGNPFGISKWKELQTSEERAPYTSL